MATDIVGNRRGTGFAMVWAVLLVLAGLVMIVLPFETGLGLAIVFSSLIIAAGVLHLVFAVVAGSFGGYLWRTLIGILYMVGGIYFLMHPVRALAAFTIVLGVIFMIEGVLQIIAFFGDSCAARRGLDALRRYRYGAAGHPDPGALALELELGAGDDCRDQSADQRNDAFHVFAGSQAGSLGHDLVGGNDRQDIGGVACLLQWT